MVIQKSTLLKVVKDMMDQIDFAADLPHSDGRDEAVEQLVHTSKGLTELLKAFK